MKKEDIKEKTIYMHKENGSVDIGEEWIFEIEQEEQAILRMNNYLSVGIDYPLFEVKLINSEYVEVE